MDIAGITDRTVRDALHAVRYAHPLTGSPLVGLASVTLLVRHERLTESPISREWMLARLLDAVIADALAELRPGGDPSAEAQGARAALDQARADFRASNPRLEAWSALWYRYVAPSPLQMGEMADELHIGERTLRRRLNQGHALLAEALRVREVAAAQELGSAMSKPALGTAAARALPDECPYRGLQAFRVQDAGFFFGRESFSELLVDTIAVTPLVGVVGPSGSGKSSVIRAGLLPWLQSEHAAMGRPFRAAELRPGPRPFVALAGALATLRREPSTSRSERAREVLSLAKALREGAIKPHDLLSDALAARGAGVLLIADQFEELYTSRTDDAEREAFLDLMLGTVFDGAGQLPVRLVLTLRADFLGHALAHRPFADALQQHVVMLGPMNRDELTRATRFPAEKQGRAFEAGLVERIVDDVGTTAGALPMLEFALTELWTRQRDGHLTHEGYEAIGRVAGALAQHAETTYAHLTPANQDRARHVFVQLVQPGEGTDDIRRTASREELATDWPLVRRLADARLVTTSHDAEGRETVELVHEALTRTWQRLMEWMSADRQFRTWQERLRSSLRQWEATGRDEGALLRGAPLAEAEEWSVERSADLTAAEHGFLRAGIALRDRRLVEHQAQVQAELSAARRLRRQAGFLAAALILVAGLGAIALVLTLREREVAHEARARELAAASDASLPVDAERAALLALEAVKATHGTHEVVLPEAWTALAATLSDLRLRRTYQCTDWTGPGVMNSDESLVAASCASGLRLWDAATGEVLRDLEDPNGAAELPAFSPDGRYLASPGADGRVRVWSLAAQAAPHTLEVSDQPVWLVTFSPDGRLLATHAMDGLVVLWRTDTWARVTRIEGVPSRLPNAVAFDAASKRIATSHVDGSVRIWDAETGALTRPLLEGHVGRVNGAAFSPDGLTLASIGADHTTRLWSLEKGEPPRILAGHTNEILALAYSPDGSRLVTASADDTARVWDTASGEAVRQLTGHRGYVSGVAFSSDGRVVYTTSADGTARAWETDSGSELTSFRSAAFSGWNPRPGADGLSLITSGTGVALWDAGSSPATVGIHTSYERLNDIGFDPQGTRVIVPHVRGASVFDANDGRELLALNPDTADAYTELYDAKFAPDGVRIVTSGANGVVRVWDASTGRKLVDLGRSTDGVPGGSIISFSPDGKRVAVTAAQPGLRVWELDRPDPVLTLDADGKAILAVAYSPDGRMIATAADAGAVQLHDAATGATLRRLPGIAGGVSYVAFSPDGEQLAAAGTTPEGGLIAVWDVATGAPERSFGLFGSAGYLAFNPTRPLIAGSGGDGITKVWNLETGRELFSITGPVGSNYVRFTPDGDGVATTFFTGVVRIQRGVLDAGELQRIVTGRLERWWTPQECITLLHAPCPPPPVRLRMAQPAKAAGR